MEWQTMNMATTATSMDATCTSLLTPDRYTVSVAEEEDPPLGWCQVKGADMESEDLQKEPETSARAAKLGDLPDPPDYGSVEDKQRDNGYEAGGEEPGHANVPGDVGGVPPQGRRDQVVPAQKAGFPGVSRLFECPFHFVSPSNGASTMLNSKNFGTFRANAAARGGARKSAAFSPLFFSRQSALNLSALTATTR